MDYEKMLDDFAEKVLNEADKHKALSEKEEFGTVRHLTLRGYSDGLYMAMAFLNGAEKKHKRANKS